MSPRRHPLALLANLLLAVLPAALRAELAFTGLIVTPDSALFALTDPASGNRSGWIGLQQEFAGHTLTAYDARTGVLTVTKDGVRSQLMLNAARVQSAASLEVQGTVNLTAGGRIAVERATLLFDQENRFPLGNGLELRVNPRKLQDGNLSFAAVFLRSKPDGTLESVAGPMTVVTLPDKAATIQIRTRDNPDDSIGFSFTPAPTPKVP